MPPLDLGDQLDISFRLIVASILGAAIGLEREIHGHPAGMRTHLLVSLGSGAFTVLSIFFFEASAGPNGMIPTDPSRIAAQIVSGIGFLGAGAILKYGSSVRGLTTAASLWATAGVGMAAGAGAWFVAGVTTVLIVFSLGPLNWVITRLRLRRQDVFRLRVQAVRLDALGQISHALASSKIEIAGVKSERLGKGRYEIELDLRPPPGAKQETIVAAVMTVPNVEVLEAGITGE
jgi:putative Mg2+ transporter-C (MgtC) family protein